LSEIGIHTSLESHNGIRDRINVARLQTTTLIPGKSKTIKKSYSNTNNVQDKNHNRKEGYNNTKGNCASHEGYTNWKNPIK
jgi:hypothetical protein